jgi:ribosomal protein L37AE/L43A
VGTGRVVDKQPVTGVTGKQRKVNMECIRCGGSFDSRRKALGYDTCLSCGEVEAGCVTFTIAPMHKSNYVVISNREDLKGLKNKGGLVR